MICDVMKDLGESQQAVYDFIKSYIEQNGYSPSLRDICKGVHLGRQTTHYHLQKLREKGYITWKDGERRTIRIVSEVV